MGASSRQPVRSMVSSGNGIKPYRSTTENRFLRGAAATIQPHDQVQMTAFASHRSLDASLTPAASPSGWAINRRVPDGYHRTTAERLRKDVLGETVLGGAIEWSGASTQLGIAAYRSQFSHPFAIGQRPYQRFDFSGRTAHMIGGYGETLLGSSHWFGEIARAPRGAIGSIGGAAVELAEGIEAVLIGRRYPRDFTSLYGRGYGAGSSSQNETGVYTALRLRRIERWDIAASFDQFWFPWLRFGIGRPTTGYAASVSAAYLPHADFEIYGRFRSRVREESATYQERTGAIQGLAPTTRQTVRLQITYRPGENWRVRTRVELSRARTGSSATHTGSLLYQDLRWSPIASLRLDGRVTLFGADEYDARLYAYETDLLYSFSVPVLYDHGQRTYLLATWTINSGIVLQAKYAVSRFLDRTTVGSGWDEIDGNQLREVRIQVRVRW